MVDSHCVRNFINVGALYYQVAVSNKLGEHRFSAIFKRRLQSQRYRIIEKGLPGIFNPGQPALSIKLSPSEGGVALTRVLGFRGGFSLRPLLPEAEEHHETEIKHEEIDQADHYAGDDVGGLGHVDKEHGDDHDLVPDKGCDYRYPEKKGGQDGGDHELGLEFLVYPDGDGEHDHRG